MRARWRAGVLAAAGAAMLVAGCGVRVAAAPSPTPPRPAATAAAAPASPAASAAAPAAQVASPDPVPTSTAIAPPVAPSSPAPSSPPATTPPARSDAHAAALEAAERRVAAAAAVRSALPVFDQLAAGMVARSGVPGAAVAVVAGDTVMYERCSGLREVGRPDRVDEDTLFPLGGVSRAYTTTLLAALAGDGELRWDQPVRSVWPGFRLRDPWATREATFRDLTSDRSGLPAYAGEELRSFGYDRAEVLRRLRHLRPAAGFRTGYAPQDALVTAAAVAAERATGDSWARLLRRRVLRPLGDDDTVLTWRGFRRDPNRATPHTSLGGSMVPQEPRDETVFAPSLGVSSSLTGLETFARLQLNGGALGGVRVAPAAALGQTLKPAAVTITPAGPEAAGLGWTLSSHDGRLLASAEGGLASGSSAVVTLVPEDGVAVIVLANAGPEGVALGRALARTLVDLAVLGAPQDEWLAREQAGLAAEVAGAAAGWTIAPAPRGTTGAAPGTAAGSPGLSLPPRPAAGAPAPRARRAYTGVYEDDYYGRVTVRPAPGGDLDVRLGRGETLRYVPWSGDVWREVESGTAAVFHVSGGRARAVTLTLLTFDGRRGRFERAG